MPRSPTTSSASGTAGGRTTVPSAPGIGSPCGSRVGCPRRASMRSMSRSETACSSTSASSWTSSQP
ncbi:Uncharacterised protein [Mycobacteroides abscessus]|nr:Uncharacterised protein [Mycobacteroides abscessus]